MPELIPALPHAEWPYVEILIRLALSLALGLLIGMERERRRKDAGLRTFGLVSLLGALGGMVSIEFSLLILLLVGVLVVLMNLQTLRSGEGAELTTSAAMLVTAVAGILCGQGHTIAPSAVMVLATALLAWKEHLADFSMGLTEAELRSALLLAILAIVIYPALPEGKIGPWALIEPRKAWLSVILIAGIGFVNYILWKLYGERGSELSGFLGGLVNSNITVIELSARVRSGSMAFVDTAYRGILLATTAMVTRNTVLLAALAPIALLGSMATFGLMLLAGMALVAWSYRPRKTVTAAASDTPLIALQPFSLTTALKYGACFLLLNVLGGVTQRYLGNVGFYMVSVLGGLMSSASAVAAAATLATQGTIAPHVAGNGAVLASFTSVAFSLSFVLRTGHRALIIRLATATAVLAAAGLLGAELSSGVQPTVSEWLMRLESHN